MTTTNLLERLTKLRSNVHHLQQASPVFIKISLGNQRHLYSVYGICSNINIDTLSHKEQKWFNQTIQKWPKFSGSALHPIPTPPSYTQSPSKLYRDHANKWRGEYGQLRIELLNFLINALIKKALLKASKKLLKQVPNLQKECEAEYGLDPSNGICNNLNILLQADNLAYRMPPVCKDLFQQWPKFSGDIIYPIPPAGPRASGLALKSNAYDAFLATPNKWIDEYGELRIELLNHMIKTLKKELK